MASDVLPTVQSCQKCTPPQRARFQYENLIKLFDAIQHLAFGAMEILDPSEETAMENMSILVVTDRLTKLTGLIPL